MKKQMTEPPRFRTESEEADWWASDAGRQFVKAQSKLAKAKGTKLTRSPLVSRLNRKISIQIAIRLPEADVAHARQIAERKGIGYQTLIKMLVHEGLAREARRS